ncbi:class I SAM-dependent methyltransferase [bacterium]|nr:class I SAM-dependent methyltransferase [bacterium]
MKSEKVRGHFRKWAKDYDAPDREKIIPGFDDFYQTVVRMIHPRKNARLHILELGPGTGILTERVLSAFPRARLTGIDLTDEMLRQAEKRLNRYRMRCVLRQGDFDTTAFDGPYDAVISSLAIHHLPPAGKRRLYKKIQRCLKSGGAFINADMVKSESAFIQKRYLALWENFMRSGGVSEDYIRRRFRGARKVDIYDTLTDQLLWLRHAGFKSVDVFWKHWNFAVFGGFV